MANLFHFLTLSAIVMIQLKTVISLEVNEFNLENEGCIGGNNGREALHSVCVVRRAHKFDELHRKKKKFVWLIMLAIKRA